MDRLLYDAPDESATRALGAALAQSLPDGSVVGLCGTLGSGKTRLVQAIAEASGVDPRDVVSPTFVLIHTYRGRRPIHHFDAYRIAGPKEFLQLGAEEYFGGDGLCFVEWADRVASCLPSDRIEVRIEVTGTNSRRFEVIPLGTTHLEWLDQLRTKLAAMGSGPASATLPPERPTNMADKSDQDR